MIRPSVVSMRNIRPGSNRPFSTTWLVGTSTTPTSLAITTRSSLVTQYRLGRRPLRSRTAPITVPSVKAIEAGPSQGSMTDAWYW